MRAWSFFTGFCRDQRGAGAAEFALVLPVVILFLFGIIDVGLYGWKINKDEKATQMGTRMAVVTDPVAYGLVGQQYVGVNGLTQGDRIPASALGVVRCTSTGTSCICDTAPCLTDMTKGSNGTAAFNAIVARMQRVDPAIQASNVVVEYRGSGLGFAGDPAGPQISPLTTVRLQGMSFYPATLMLFKSSIGLPSFSYTLTMEDGRGTMSN
ncbi:MAG: pilus assembly protein [Sphingomonadales bacterium]|nr:pilus assembly protein [Sphingomonadales bacterium]MDE2568022.1 pilus assembly protein [Sphingomonadales bacterium]